MPFVDARAPFGVADAKAGPEAAPALGALAGGAVDAAGAAVVWATRPGAAAGAADDGAAGGALSAACAICFTGVRTGSAGTFCAKDATCTGALEAELVAAFCADTTPKAARPKAAKAATRMTTNRIVPSRRHPAPQRWSESAIGERVNGDVLHEVKDRGCGFRGADMVDRFG